MKHKKITNRKERRTKRKILLYSLTGGIVFLIGGGVFLFWVTQFHPELYVSPLPLTASAQGGDVDGKAVIAKELKEQNIAYTDILLSQDSFYIVMLEDKNEVWLSAEKDIPLQLASLQVILTRLTMEGKRFKKLDLRFDKPVIAL